MTLKDQLALDLPIFLNFDEFAEEHDLNGAYCIAVIQAPTANESFVSPRSRVSDTGISRLSVFVHCRTEDLPELPSQGNVFTLDGKLYTVANCVEECGLASIELQAETRGFYD